MYIVEWHNTELVGKQRGSSSYAGISYWIDVTEVIGNIHDNPNLLKGGQKWVTIYSPVSVISINQSRQSSAVHGYIENGRNFIGFELNAEYMSIINKKIQVTPNMFYLW